MLNCVKVCVCHTSIKGYLLTYLTNKLVVPSTMQSY